MICKRMEEAKAFFLCLKFDSVAAVVQKKKKARWKLCALESHWHVQNANSVTTILLRIRKLILTEWKQVNTVDSVKNTQHIKRQNSLMQRK